MNYELKLPDGYVKPKLLRRDKWTAALRSGEYKKGTLYLCSNDKFCCLGVLASLEGTLKPNACNLDSETPQFRTLNRYGEFPKGVKVYGDEVCLSACNDSHSLGLTFQDIADIIEAVWDNEEAESKDNGADA